jgi:ornithine cyclodeaminase/alanine dehydrogenase-like protein (mu-crystallin family)
LSAVAAKRLARPDAAIAAFIGCGVQAQSHLQSFAALFPLKQIRAFGVERSIGMHCVEVLNKWV